MWPNTAIISLTISLDLKEFSRVIDYNLLFSIINAAASFEVVFCVQDDNRDRLSFLSRQELFHKAMGKMYLLIYTKLYDLFQRRLNSLRWERMIIWPESTISDHYICCSWYFYFQGILTAE